jgi:glycine betaine/choline ABC-type transport system substrate-binding protein
MRLSRRTLVPSFLGAGLVAARGDVILAGEAQPPEITVGALGFTESSILAEMLAHLLVDAGFTVQVAHDMGTSEETHAALVNGEIDMYVEYTGGGLVAILGLPVPAASEAGQATPAVPVADLVYATVSAEYRQQFNLVWLDELGFNNAYALAVTPETAAAYGLVTVGDLAAHAGELTLGTDLEFPDRQDGLPGLEETYGITFANVAPGEPALMYDAIAAGEVDVITAYTTDAHLRDLELVFLEDDRGFFPPYHAAPVVRQALLDEQPDVATVINQLGGQIDEAEMIDLNSRVDLDGMAPADVARGFLEANGLLAPGA